MALLALHDVPAPAKLNLFLHIEGRRDDGFHLLDSLMVPIDWCDTLHFEMRRDGRITRCDLALALPADDLCTRAARALQRASATDLGVEIGIVKRIPWGAGLGGGSSDAASTLLALNRLWALDWPLEALMPIGLSLGADVPFFLGGGAARVGGIGERLQPADVTPAWFAVVKPAEGLSTKAVFSSPEVARAVAAARIVGFSERQQELPGDIAWRNDLQAAAEALCPDVVMACARLFEVFGNSRVTGSGSAVFARAGSIGDAGASQRAAPSMPSDWPAGWTSRMCRSLERHPLVGWAGEGGRGVQVRGASREPV